jgi:hypothetical protein
MHDIYRKTGTAPAQVATTVLILTGEDISQLVWETLKHAFIYLCVILCLLAL